MRYSILIPRSRSATTQFSFPRKSDGMMARGPGWFANGGCGIKISRAYRVTIIRALRADWSGSPRARAASNPPIRMILAWIACYPATRLLRWFPERIQLRRGIRAAFVWLTFSVISRRCFSSALHASLLRAVSFLPLFWWYSNSGWVEDKSGRKIRRHDKSIPAQRTPLYRARLCVYTTHARVCTHGARISRTLRHATETELGVWFQRAERRVKIRSTKPAAWLHPRGFPARDRTSVVPRIQQQREPAESNLLLQGDRITRGDPEELEEQGGRSDQLRRSRRRERLRLLAESRFSR